MLDGPNGLHKLGGISFVASGSLFLAKSALELSIGPPPSTGAAILEWTASQSLLLAITSEVFFFALTLMVPAVMALHENIARTHRSHAAAGCGILAVTIPVLAVLAIVHGRLVHPVFHIRAHTADVAELLVATYFGGMHAVAILFAVATFVLSLAMRRGAYGRGIAYLGFATSGFDLIGAYPELIGPIPALVCGMFFAAWFVAVGFKLYGMSPAAQP